MDGGDLWSSRLSSSSFRRYHLRSDAYLGDELEVEDEYKQEFSCPFCADEFDIVGLFCHMDEEHQLELKNGTDACVVFTTVITFEGRAMKSVCPVCAKRAGVDIVGHMTMQHGNILKVQRKRRLRRGAPSSMFNILRKELREGNRQSLFGGSSFLLSSANPDTDPLLSSFIYNPTSAEDLGKEEPRNSKEAASMPKALEEGSVESPQQTVLSKTDQEEAAKKCEFVQGLLLSSMLDDIL